MRFKLAAFCLLLAGCGARYDTFRLPDPPSEPEVRYHWAIRPDPVITRGNAGSWDSTDVLNPALFRYNGALLNLYSGFDGKTWHTGLASTFDGLSWNKLGKVISPDPNSWEGSYIAANGTALAEGGQILYWYQSGSPVRIGMARSSDARTFTKESKPVLETGPSGSWDERGVGDPNVVLAAGQFYMFYLGQDRAGKQRLGVAKSPDGRTWTKLKENPILDIGADGAFDENGLGEPAVWIAGGRYWMLYTGRDRHEMRRIGGAQSRDGVHWERTTAIPVLSGDQPWDDKVVCDPSVEKTAEGVRVWFGGGNVASPDQRLNGAIGYAELRPVH